MVKLTNGYTMLPEGRDIFKIVSVENKEKFGKLIVKFRNAEGLTAQEQYQILKDVKKGEYNEGALNAFSFMAKTALQDFDVEEIDEQELVGHFLSADVQYQVVQGDDGKERKYSHLRQFEQADGFDREEKIVKKTIEKNANYKASEPDHSAADNGIDLDSLLD